MLSLNNIKPAKGATKKKKRIGRGNASGHGTSSTKGTKGQKARSGVSDLKKLGMKQIIRRLPKNRGFKSLAAKNQVVNLEDLNKYFKDGDTINPQTLVNKELIKNTTTNVKILGTGDLKLKNLVFEGVKMSESVKKKI